jgi:ubiquinone/menaquinone biosynthesis C-methylase UbiE
VKRVLKPGGTLCINHVAQEQVDAYWFLDYVPECRERWRSTLVPNDELKAMMANAGLR